MKVWTYKDDLDLRAWLYVMDARPDLLEQPSEAEEQAVLDMWQVMQNLDRPASVAEPEWFRGQSGPADSIGA